MWEDFRMNKVKQIMLGVVLVPLFGVAAARPISAQRRWLGVNSD